MLSIGRFLRLAVTGLAQRVIYEDLPEPDALLELCEDIFLARKAGQLWLEELMYHELISIYRSPERLVAITKLPQSSAWGGTGIPPPELVRRSYERELTKETKKDV